LLLSVCTLLRNIVVGCGATANSSEYQVPCIQKALSTYKDRAVPPRAGEDIRSTRRRMKDWSANRLPWRDGFVVSFAANNSKRGIVLICCLLLCFARIVVVIMPCASFALEISLQSSTSRARKKLLKGEKHKGSSPSNFIARFELSV